MYTLRTRRILVTGATGFIGSHLTRKLVELGSKVSVLLRESSARWRIADIVAELDIHSGDLRDFDFVKAAVQIIKPEKIFHLAAYVDVTRSLTKAKEIFDTNVLGVINLFRALEGIDYDCFINTGTCEEYGDNVAPFHENQPPNPVSPYSASKASVTLFCKMLHKTMGCPVITVRPFLCYGPNQEPNRLIPQAILASLQEKEFRITYGEQTREFNYVLDTVDGLIKASVSKNAIGEIINIGNGIEHRIKDVVVKIFDIIGGQTRPLIGALPYRPGETWHFYCDNSKAKRLLNWAPQTDLDAGLEKTIEWYSKHKVSR